MSEPSVSAPAAASPAPMGSGPTASAPGFFTRLLLRPRHASFSLKEGQLFLLLAIIIGLFSGLLVVCFQIAIAWVRLALLGSSLAPSPARVLLVPTLAGLMTAALVMRVFRRARGSGVNQTKEAVYVSDGYIPFSTVVGKFVTCALAIGSGQSLGPEDPSLQIGAGLASALGRRLRLSRDKVRLIAPVGAAAGLAAAFNAPISAVLFVIEEVIGQWNAAVLGAIVLAAVSSVVVERGFMGAEPLFRIPAYRLAHVSELGAYAVLGVAGGVASHVFVRLVGWLRPRLKALPRWTQYLQPAAAGLLIGVAGIGLPQVMGAGYEVIDQAMHDEYAWRVLLILAGAKILATTLSFSSGTPGGVFAPTLFVGAMMGGAVGAVEHHFFPALAGPGASVGAYALVGMGALFAGFLRAPMTSVFMVLELSGNYSIIVPVIISNTIAYVMARKYKKTPLFDMLARQDGMDLPSMEERREESSLRVEDAMRPYGGPVLRGDESVEGALARLRDFPEQHFLLDAGVRGWSLLTRELLEWQAQQGKSDVPLVALPTHVRLPALHPDQPLDAALRQIGDRPLLPVVSRGDFHKLEGVVTLDSALRTFRGAPAPEASP